MRPLHATVALLPLLAGCFYDVRAPQLNETPESWPNEVPVVADGACAPDTFTWVACVIDGDTFDTLSCGEQFGDRVRMLGIDAPETAKEDAPAECYADAATAELRRLIDGREVLLTFDKECVGTFGRKLAYVWVPADDGDLIEIDDNDDVSINIDNLALVNLAMLSNGFARVFPEEQFGAIRLQSQFEAAEAEAQSRGIGLWAECE